MRVTGSEAAEFGQVVDLAIKGFEENAICRRIIDGSLAMTHYHKLLAMLYHQVYRAPMSFAIAAAACDSSRISLRDYLLAHADEEKMHHTWILDDLRATGYDGAPLEADLPHPLAECYIAYNYYIAHEFPLGRLALASFLETLGGRFASSYAARAFRCLSLTREQATFFLSHAQSDAVHMHDVRSAIVTAAPTASEWLHMRNIVDNAAGMYAAIYDEAGR